MQRGFGGAEGHALGFSRLQGAQQDLVGSSGVHQGAEGFRRVVGRLSRVQWGAVGYSEMLLDLFSITAAPALPWRWEKRGEEQRGRGLLGLLQTFPAPSLALPPCARYFQGKGCRIQCKRQRHDLHVKLNSP